MIRDVCVSQAADRIASPTFATTETHDPETHGQCFTAWRCSYEHVVRQPFRGEVSELCLWPLQIFRDRVDQPCIWRGLAWRGALSFFSFAASQGNLSYQGREVIPTAVTVVPWDCPESVFCSGPTDSMSVSVDEEALARYAQGLLGKEISRQQLHCSRTIRDPSMVAQFQSTATAILDELAACPDLLASEAYQSGVKHRMLTLLVELIDGSASADQQWPPPSTRSYIVDKAIQYIESRVADPLLMSEVCRAIRVSARTLRYSFEEVVGVSPSQYLLALRLERVRQGLLQSRSDGRIHCIAERYGFAHMGRFAQFYYDAFGEHPSDTRKRAGIKGRFSGKPLVADSETAVHAC